MSIEKRDNSLILQTIIPEKAVQKKVNSGEISHDLYQKYAIKTGFFPTIEGQIIVKIGGKYGKIRAFFVEKSGEKQRKKQRKIRFLVIGMEDKGVALGIC